MNCTPGESVQKRRREKSVGDGKRVNFMSREQKQKQNYVTYVLLLMALNKKNIENVMIHVRVKLTVIAQYNFSRD